MNKIIRVIRLSTPEELRRSIKFIVDQLEKHNHAVITSKPDVVRLFARFIPEFYRKRGIMLFSSTNLYGVTKNIITVNDDYFIKKEGRYKIRIKLREK